MADRDDAAAVGDQVLDVDLALVGHDVRAALVAVRLLRSRAGRP